MQVKDLTDGRYMISFTPEESGEYVVSALVNGEEILQDQELQATVAVPPLTVDMCALYVPEQARVVPAGAPRLPVPYFLHCRNPSTLPPFVRGSGSFPGGVPRYLTLMNCSGLSNFETPMR